MTQKKSQEELRTPARAYQCSVVFAFRKIVRMQQTPAGTPWMPARILDELWVLWDERPKAAGHKIEFVGRNSPNSHYQTIERLKGGRIRSIQNPLLFSLIDKFVQKHAKSDDFVLPAIELKRIHETAEKICTFTMPFEPRQYESIRKEKHDAQMAKVCGSSIVLELLGETDNDIEYLAYNIPEEKNMWNRGYFSSVRFKTDEHQVEYGFIIPTSDTIFLKRFIQLESKWLLRTDWVHENGPKFVTDLSSRMNFRILIVMPRSVVERQQEAGQGAVVLDTLTFRTYAFESANDGYAISLAQKYLKVIDLT